MSNPCSTRHMLGLMPSQSVKTETETKSVATKPDVSPEPVVHDLAAFLPGKDKRDLTPLS